MSFSTLIDLAWILKMLVRPSRSGSENSTFLSRRPGLMRAVQSVRSVGGHQHLDVAPGVETIQLVDQLQHCSLDFIVTTGSVIKSGSTHCVNFIKEDKASLLCSSHLEQFPHHSGSFSNVFLHQLGSD